jgi:hypothetical protein
MASPSGRKVSVEGAAKQPQSEASKLVALLRIGAVDAGAAGVRKTAYPQAPC